MKKTAANADNIYVDPSALRKLYLHEPESRAMTAWRASLRGPLTVTLFGRVEIANAIGLAAFRGFIPKAAHRAALVALDDDFAAGRCILADLLWRTALRSAEDLSRTRTPVLGTRSLDVLHVASALSLKRRYFLTLDQRQQKLAQAAGLSLLAPPAV